MVSSNVKLLYKPSDIVADNAQYHYFISDKISSINSSKSELIVWFINMCHETKEELLNKLNKIRHR